MPNSLFMPGGDQQIQVKFFISISDHKNGQKYIIQEHQVHKNQKVKR